MGVVGFHAARGSRKIMQDFAKEAIVHVQMNGFLHRRVAFPEVSKIMISSHHWGDPAGLADHIEEFRRPIMRDTSLEQLIIGTLLAGRTFVEAWNVRPPSCLPT